jgi:hypothetical protein
MGGGGGSSGPFKIGGISGQGGGRILPGSSTGIGKLIMPVDDIFTAPGGGPGEPGKSDSFNAGSGGIEPFAGGGGGWGALGGAGGATLSDNTFQSGANLGAAGGKAIDTNGHSVTWLGGANRAYGAVG